MVNYKLSPQAETDLIRIHQHGVREYGEEQGDRYYYNLTARFKKIAENPYMYQAVDHIREGYRRSVCGVDSIYYRIKDDTVEIMSILGRQDTDEALS